MIGNPLEITKWLFGQNKEKLYEIKEYHKKRSLNSNSYCWALVGKIADVLRTSKEEIYIQMLEDYGQSLLIPVEEGKKPDGYFKYFKFVTKSELNGKTADWYKVFKGSSNYDAREMSILIDGIIYEAQELGIETITPNEVEQLKKMWGA